MPSVPKAQVRPVNDPSIYIAHSENCIRSHRPIETRHVISSRLYSIKISTFVGNFLSTVLTNRSKALASFCQVSHDPDRP